MAETAITVVSRSVWGAAPQTALWYGFVVVKTPEGETDYFYDYSTMTQDVPDLNMLCPDGCSILDRELRLTPKGRDFIGHWAREEEIYSSER